MSQFKLYSNPLSPYATLVQAALENKNLDYEFCFVDLMAGQQNQPDFLNKNPFGLVPTLCLPCGTCMYESSAIIEYLDEKYAQGPMIPKQEPQRSQIRQLLSYLATNLIPAYRPLFLNAVGWHKITQAEKEECEQKLIKRFTHFETEWNKVSDVQFCALCALFYQSWMNLQSLCPNVTNALPSLTNRWNKIAQSPVIQKVEARPEVKQARQAAMAMFRIPATV